MVLKDFQIDAIKELHQAVSGNKDTIILESGTGSGKTIILTHFINEYLNENSDYVFVWFCPGKGDLEEQSKAKMEKYIPQSTTCRLQDVLTPRGFQEGDTVFINWELVTKTGNKALSEGEFMNLYNAVEKALNNGIRFIVVIDEEHLNNTIKSYDIVNIFNPTKIIRASATPQKDDKAKHIIIPEERVIAEGLIKKLLIINENIEDGINLERQVDYLLNLALNKQEQLKKELNKYDSIVNPLIIIQLPNNSDDLVESVERYLEARNITYFNGQLAVWLANKKENLDGIEDNTSPVVAVIIKQAVATGWDCPRAHILVKLRDNMSETFEIQTIGRIRRMPEAMHYENPLLDNCYLYTFDEKFSEGAKIHLKDKAINAKTIFLKSQFRNFAMKKEKISAMYSSINPMLALESFRTLLEKDYHLTKGKYKENIELIRAYKYDLDSEIKIRTYKGSISTLKKRELLHLNNVTLKMLLDTHEHGRTFHHTLADIGRKIGLTYDSMANIVRKLFCIAPAYKNKMLSLSHKELYAFVINNSSRLKQDLLKAISSNDYIQTAILEGNNIIDDYKIPQECLFTYDSSIRDAEVYAKNVYEEYLSSAVPRSQGEILFEQHCEESANIDWFLKNGDKGNEYFSIVYSDNAGRRRHFYPDYILGAKNKVWVVEVKGGESADGESEDIDAFSEKKMDALLNYCSKYNLQGGVVRINKHNMKLYISTTKYIENMADKCWILIDKVL